MKVLFLVDGHVLRMGGAELQAFNLAKSLIARGHEVEVVAPYLDRNTEQLTERSGVRVRQLGYWRFPKLSSAMFMLRFAFFLLLEGRKYDAIHVHMVHRMASVVGLMRYFVPCPVVAKVSGAYELQNGEQLKIRFGSLQYWFYKAIRQIDYFQAISEDTQTRLKAGGIPAEKIIGLPNGVDTDLFQPSRALHTNSRLDKTIISYCGRLVPVKGLATLIDAAAQLKCLHPDQFELHLYGDGELRQELEQSVVRQDLRDVVFFHGRFDSTVDALADAHIYVQVSQYEGLSNAVLEAMSSGLPLVLSAVGGNIDVVDVGVNGVLVPPGETRAVVESLSGLIADRSRCQEMGVQSRVIAERRYSMDSVVERLLNLYGSRNGTVLINGPGIEDSQA